MAAYDAETGEKQWKFYTVPLPGDPGSETWGTWTPAGGGTWTTGSYDPDLDILYWASDDPGPSYNGDIRPGDNLWTNTIFALNPDTGERLWYFQVIPHGVWDYDAIGDLVLVDLEINGEQRKVVYQANRGGYFVVLDRQTGEFLHGAPYIYLNWSSGLDANGRPVIVEDKIPTAGRGAVKVSPNIGGGKNWPPTTYSPRTGYAYFYATEGSALLSPPKLIYENGKAIWRNGTRLDRFEAEAYSKFMAVDVRTAETVWEYLPDGSIYAGVMSTAGGLVFIGDGSGRLLAFHEETGDILWHFQTGGRISASPVTYAVNGTQYVAVASGHNMMYAFKLMRD